MKKVFLMLLVASGLMLTSCYQAPEDGIAKIKIVTSSHFSQPGANVHFYGPSGSFIDFNRTTDMNGEIVYEHDPALEVVLTVDATYGASSAHGIVRIKPNETANETYVLNP